MTGRWSCFLSCISCIALASLTPACDDGAATDASGDDASEAGDTGGDGDGDGDGLQVTCDGPCPEQWPTPTGPCPELTTGVHTFQPAGIEPRDVKLWVGDSLAEEDGPLVFYWHGTGSEPDEVFYGLGVDAMEEITSAGGMVAAPFHDPAAGQFPWYLVVGDQDDDLRVADEVLGCMIEQAGVDGRRIHVTGMSAGGLMTTQMAYRRSDYVASVASHSGGIFLDTPARADPDNPFAALILHGGEDDIVYISFKDTSEAFFNDLREHDQFAAICDHGLGHTIDLDMVPNLWQFFKDHPYGTQPSPYEGELPAAFPDYCGLELPPG